MLLSEYLKKNYDTTYGYVGTIWGSESFIATGNELVDILHEMPDNDENMLGICSATIFGGRGYYISDWGDIHYINSPWINELVLKIIE